MSLINKVLRDLDRRNATAGESGTMPPKVKAVEPEPATQEWFWRIVGALLVVALGWVGWIVYQVQPRPIATELARKAADEARMRPTAPRPQVAAAPAPVVQAPPEAPPPPKPVGSAVEPRETMRFAYSIDTPIGAPASKPEPKKRSDQPAAKKQPTSLARTESSEAKSRIERRDRVPSAPERAETEFRRGVDLLKQGRSREAEAAFAASLSSDPAHHGARQALVALKLERRELGQASRLLQEGLALDPAQADFAVALARIRIEGGQLPSALDALDAAASAGSNYAELHALRGTVLQRLGRHAEAAAAYRAALGVEPATPNAWLGLGISLEALQQKPEAAQAFRNALASGPTSVELKTFAEQRIRALR